MFADLVQKVGNAHNEVNFREGEARLAEHGDCRGGSRKSRRDGPI